MRIFLSLLLLSSLSAEAAVIDLGTLGGDYSFARDINERGSVAGEAKTSQGLTHAFIWKSGTMTDLGTLPGQAFSMANGLNNHDEVVGYGRGSASYGQSKAILWDSTGRPVALPHLRGESYSQASDLNDRGDIAGVSGTHAVVWIDRKAQKLPSLGGDFAIALGINNTAWIVGNSLTAEGEVHATLWIEGEAKDLGTLGGRFSTANAINDRNQIVGSSETAEGAVHAFLWEAGTMKDLGLGMIRNLNADSAFAGEKPLDLEAKELSHALIWNQNFIERSLEILPEAVYSSAFGINSAGVAVGVSEIRKSTDSTSGDSGFFHATLWTP